MTEIRGSVVGKTAATWGLSVLALGDGDRWPAVIAQPDEEAMHDEFAVRLKSAGLKRMTPHEWSAGMWPLSQCSVTVQDGHITQLHTGRSRILLPTPPAVSPGWTEAAKRGRAVLALLRPGTLDPAAATGETIVSTDGEEVWPELQEAVAKRAMIAGLAQIRTDAEPYGRRW